MTKLTPSCFISAIVTTTTTIVQIRVEIAAYSIVFATTAFTTPFKCLLDHNSFHFLFFLAAMFAFTFFRVTTLSPATIATLFAQQYYTFLVGTAAFAFTASRKFFAFTASIVSTAITHSTSPDAILDSDIVKIV